MPIPTLRRAVSIAAMALLVGVAAGMKPPIWTGGSTASQIVVYGLK